ncbi:MAG: hypothetical protein WBY93_06475 [Candidatus Binatus sp.]
MLEQLGSSQAMRNVRRSIAKKFGVALSEWLLIGAPPNRIVA